MALGRYDVGHIVLRGWHTDLESGQGSSRRAGSYLDEKVWQRGVSAELDTGRKIQILTCRL